MKVTSDNEISNLLKTIGMKLGQHNKIVGLNGELEFHKNCKIYQAPRDSIGMYCFAFKIAEWLPKGDWKIFQIEDLTELSEDENFFISRLLGLGEEVILKDKGVIFEFHKNLKHKKSEEMALVFLIYAFLMFEHHANVVSSESRDGEILGIQDGFIYFLYRSDLSHSVQKLINDIELNPLKIPNWVFSENNR